MVLALDGASIFNCIVPVSDLCYSKPVKAYLKRRTIMYILTFVQGQSHHMVGIFESLTAGRVFVEKIPGYERHEYDFEGVTQVEEFFHEDELPDYTEIPCGNLRIPLSKWMFDSYPGPLIDIEWKELPQFDGQGTGLIEGQTRVDAYCIPNDEVENYIKNREYNFERAKKYLRSQKWQVSRSFRGSQDGEAILVRRPKEDWHFLMHMDPMFVEQLPTDDEAFNQEIQEALDEFE